MPAIEATSAGSAASTTEAVAAVAAGRDAPPAAAPVAGPFEPDCQGEGERYQIGAGVERAVVVPYRRRKGDPLYRPLRIYTMDPAVPRLDGAVATVNVAYEPLAPGPVGQLFEVDPTDAGQQQTYRVADLDDQAVLIANGYAPSPADPRFHQQMVYAVCSNVYAAFATALGRNLTWGFGEKDGEAARLRLRPHHGPQQNASFDNLGTRGELCFGYYPAPEVPSGIRTMPGGFVFTCLSHDIVAHEVTHALLDGLREHFAVPSNSDVAAFHEGFADLMAIFQHFSYTEVVLTAVRRSRGQLANASLLMQLASEFGHTTGRGRPLRTALDGEGEPPRQYRPDLPIHELGSILVNAVFRAFVEVFRRKTERFFRLASQGTGVLPQGELPHDLQSVLAEHASRLASQFQTICIRAIDYCPPVGLNFGDYLRAMITADTDVAPDDPWDYRGALVDAFWRSNIYPRSASSLSEDALVWRPPRVEMAPIVELSFAMLQFRGDPAHTAPVKERRRQACALGRYLTDLAHAGYLEELGMVRDRDDRLSGDTVTLPCVESVRSARRVGPNGQIVFDLVAEVTQLRHVQSSEAGPAFSYHGGATLIIGPEGEIRYAIVKSVVGIERLERRRRFLLSECGGKLGARSAIDGVPTNMSFGARCQADPCDLSGLPT